MEDLYNYYAEIAEYVPNLPIFSYILVRLLMPLMKRLVDIPNVVGLKYSNSNMYELRHVIDLRQQNWTGSFWNGRTMRFCYHARCPRSYWLNAQLYAGSLLPNSRLLKKWQT